MDPTAAGMTFPPYEFHVERGKIREFADAIGDPNPLYRDPDYAAKTKYGGIVALPSFLFSTSRIVSGYVGGLPGVHAMFEEGQTASVSTDDLTVRNEQTGEVRKALPVPRQLLDLMCGGGIFPLLESQGLITPLPAKPGKTETLTA